MIKIIYEGIEMIKINIVLIACLALTACYPIYKTQKPEVEVTVVDEQDQPIEKAKVVLMTEVHPAKRDAKFDEKYSNQKGEVSFTKQAEWKVEFLMIHGVQYYDWNICVAKSGYLTQELIKVDSETKVKIALKKGNNPKREFPYFC